MNNSSSSSSLGSNTGSSSAAALDAGMTKLSPASEVENPKSESLADDLDKKVNLSNQIDPESHRGKTQDEGKDATRESSRVASSKDEEGEEDDSPMQKALKNPYHRPLPGHPGNLTTSQAEALLQLTLLLKKDGALHDPNEEPPSFQETQLLRFLRARSFNVQAARTMYLKAEAWKKEIELDRLCREFVFEEEEAVAACGWRMYFHKVDKLGRPVLIQDFSNLDTTALVQATTPDRIVKFFAVTLELAVRHRYEACTISSGRWVDDNMMVVNLEGMGLSTFWTMKDQLQELLSILDNNFPELSGRVQIINAPWVFGSIWSWVKGWLPTNTAEKIDIAGSAYLPLILKYIKSEDFPPHLGGECACTVGGDGEAKAVKACTRSDVGPWERALADARSSL